MIRSLIDPKGTRGDSGIKEWRRGVLCALLLVASVAAAQEAGTGVSGAWAPGVETRDDPAHFRVGVNVGLIAQSWTLTPRIGWQWIWASGLATGIDLGVQFTISHQETLILPPGTPPDVAHDARKYLEFGATLPLPSLNFRIGYHLG
jgi:hypothetical protein